MLSSIFFIALGLSLFIFFSILEIVSHSGVRICALRNVNMSNFSYVAKLYIMSYIRENCVNLKSYEYKKVAD